MGGSGGHYINFNKPGTGKLILHVLAYTWKCSFQEFLLIYGSQLWFKIINCIFPNSKRGFEWFQHKEMINVREINMPVTLF